MNFNKIAIVFLEVISIAVISLVVVHHIPNPNLSFWDRLVIVVCALVASGWILRLTKMISDSERERRYFQNAQEQIDSEDSHGIP